MMKAIVTAMRRHCAPGTCGFIVLGMLVAAWAPASIASEACDQLVANTAKYRTGVQATDPMKAQGAGVTRSSTSSNRVVVSWGIASNTPMGAISEWCVKKVHVSSGLNRELCGSQTGITNVADNNCFGNDPNYGTPLGCPNGSFKFSIQMKTSCGYDGPWVATNPVQIELN